MRRFHKMKAPHFFARGEAQDRTRIYTALMFLSHTLVYP
jgi:hypothetical protein